MPWKHQTIRPWMCEILISHHRQAASSVGCALLRCSRCCQHFSRLIWHQSSCFQKSWLYWPPPQTQGSTFSSKNFYFVLRFLLVDLSGWGLCLINMHLPKFFLFVYLCFGPLSCFSLFGCVCYFVGRHVQHELNKMYYFCNRQIYNKSMIDPHCWTGKKPLRFIGEDGEKNQKWRIRIFSRQFKVMAINLDESCWLKTIQTRREENQLDKKRRIMCV